MKDCSILPVKTLRMVDRPSQWLVRGQDLLNLYHYAI